MRIYLGRSPLHERDMAFVLDQVKEHLSPQSHVYFYLGLHKFKQDGFDCLCTVKPGLIIRIGQIGKNKLMGEQILKGISGPK